jgi:hypothetical protein
MIEDDRYCIDIVQQLTALSAAVDEVSLLILESHIEGCVADAIRDRHGEVRIKELRRPHRVRYAPQPLKDCVAQAVAHGVADQKGAGEYGGAITGQQIVMCGGASL